MDPPVADPGPTKDEGVGSKGEMDLPVANRGPVRDEGQLLQCPYCDSEAMHKLAQFLLPGLAAVCVDGTTGDLFRSPSVVAVDLRQEMVDYVTQRSETFIADTLIESEVEQNAENQMPDDPYEVISIFMDDFSRTKRNIIGHVSGWLLSDSREDKIDDFVQEMDMTRFWPLERREGIAEVLLKNVDIKTKFHCPEKYENEERLADHKAQCSFRPVTCPNDGCRAKVSVRCMQDHDAACLFKILQCEQNCEKRLLRRDMDRHCVTVCPMRPMKCPFGCDSSFPEHNLEEHCSESLQQHLLKVLQVIHKKGLTADQLNDRALELEKSEVRGKLAKARDARSLTNIVKDLEAKKTPPS
ncbi:hypothetical protein CFC21_100372 [Triticum aestivum]|uniref:TRAF-type domain-containing protein n=3 Tax=Triticum TaxID=4564 RepID=A0A9R0ZQJ2_TRITD|nr:uncharacterized protein LOC123149569 [Triticum aestivum]XP_044425187.1 uncharacterized protein LOC123149569 [Triticum aestivum]KAF7098647.1 hypothetical protein CFC21_100372 [Triticum aestivum]VAI81143.1 unnamed protein product [Triticum turgidum subsp. durum]